MLIDFSHRFADVYRTNEKGTYFVKVSFPGAGLYVKAVRVVPSKKEEGKYVVYKPKMCLGFNKWDTNYEFANSSELWLLIQEEALKAVDTHHITTNFDDIDAMDIDKELSKAIDDLG